jgi:hypothetical protein
MLYRTVRPTLPQRLCVDWRPWVSRARALDRRLHLYKEKLLDLLLPRTFPATQCSNSRVALIDPKSLKSVFTPIVQLIIGKDYVCVPLKMQIFTAILAAASTVTAHCQYIYAFYPILPV